MKSGVSFWGLSAAFISLAGCVCELVPDENAGVLPERVEVIFALNSGTGPSVRSSIAAQEELVRDINLYIYADGRLEHACYAEGREDICIELRAGTAYDFYALANVGEIAPPVDEGELPSLRYDIEGPDSFGGCLPMAWAGKDMSVIGNSFRVDVALERLVSKVHFSVDRSGLDGLRVKSVRLRQSALDVCPFPMVSDGVRGSAATVVGDCDYASESDLAALNSGESIFFYTMENCRGTLLPGNADEWAKTPEHIGEEAELCTYVEVECEFDEGVMYEGNVTYRFYAGLDNVSNFDVVRNTDIRISLFVTGEGMRRLSWRVESSVGVNPGYAYGVVRNGLHGQSDLYVGEVFVYGISIAPELLRDCGGNLEECSVGFVASGAGKDEAILFDGIVRDAGNSASGTAVGRCVGDARGKIWLYDGDGREIVCLADNVMVSRPAMRLSYVSSADRNDNVELVDEPLSCIINGGDEYVYAYCVDSADKNLNSSRAYGYDLSLFDFNGFVVDSKYGIRECITICAEPGEECSGGYAAKFSYRTDNDGSDADRNIVLTSSLFCSTAANLAFREDNYGAYCPLGMSLGYSAITLTLVDNGWAGYHDTQLSLIVDNPSNLTLRIDVWEIVKADKHIIASERQKDLDYHGNVIRSSYIPYVSPVYYNGAPDIYGTGLRIYSERNSEGDYFLSSGNLMVYPLYGISTELIRASISDVKNGHRSLHHLFEVTSAGYAIADVNIVDHLDDGSMKFGIIYGNDPEYGGGWNDRGIWKYSNNRLTRKPETSLDTYAGMTPLNLFDIESHNRRGPVEVSVSYEGGYLYADVKNNIKGISVDVSLSGTVEGAVTTYPNGTWGASKDNYCSKTFSGEKKGIALSGTRVRLDNGALKTAIDGVYATTFFDSKNWIGSSNSYQHSAHPTRITLKMQIKASGTAQGMYPVTVTFVNGNVSYYHAQDNTTYTVAFSPVSEQFLFVHVQKK